MRVIGFSPTNRGVALLDDRVYVGTLNAHLVALDAVSGAVRWDVEVADNALGYAITSAPLAIDGKIIIGVSGGEAGVRGFLDAYDARTGTRVWRFYTVPGPGEQGHDTWGGDSWKTGGAPTWLTGSLRPGAEPALLGHRQSRRPTGTATIALATTCTAARSIALDAATGELRWHFQFTPHDTHDWDANQIPVLVDAASRRVARASWWSRPTATGSTTCSTAPRASSCAARRTRNRRGRSGLDARGRPIVIPGKEPSETGTLVWPSLQGATNWFSPAFDARRQVLFVPVREMGSSYFKTEATYEPGKPFMGGGEVVEAARRGVRRCSRARCADGRATMGASSALAALGRRDGHGRRSGLRQHERRQRVRPRRRHWPAAVGFSDGRQLHGQPDLVPDRRTSARRDRVRSGAVRVRPALTFAIERGEHPLRQRRQVIDPHSGGGVDGRENRRHDGDHRDLADSACAVRTARLGPFERDRLDHRRGIDGRRKVARPEA